MTARHERGAEDQAGRLFDKLLADRDALLAALKEFIAWDNAPLKGSGHTAFLAVLLSRARAAIAQAEGRT